jgi:hypothetical protein
MPSMTGAAPVVSRILRWQMQPNPHCGQREIYEIWNSLVTRSTLIGPRAMVPCHAPTLAAADRPMD